MWYYEEIRFYLQFYSARFVMEYIACMHVQDVIMHMLRENFQAVTENV